MAMCYPDKELGSPPMLAATAGRMNACGISVFYASTDPAAAIVVYEGSEGLNCRRASAMAPYRIPGAPAG
jgi:hypothetical protein